MELWLHLAGKVEESWDIVEGMMRQLEIMDCRNWRYKYVVWMIDTVIDQTHPRMQAVTLNLYHTAFTHSLRPNYPIRSLFSPLIHHVHSQPLTPFILTL